MWGKSLENVRFGDPRNEKNRDEISIRIPGVLPEIQTEGETRQAMYVQRNIEAHSCNHCCNGKGINITYYECAFVALGTQHAMRMRRVIYSPMAGPAPQYFSKL